MYNIPHFKEKDTAEVFEFMKANSFAMLIGCTNNIPYATQVPLLFEQRNDTIFLHGHIMRNTDHHKALEDNNTVLCVFTGAHTYVSARLYNNQQTASTWNYMSVHARGKLRFMQDEELLDVLHKTTNLYEADTASPAGFENLPKEYVDRLAKAIVGIEIEVTTIDHVFKLSQNKSAEEFHRITAHLEQGDGGEKIIAEEMGKRKDKLFPNI